MCEGRLRLLCLKLLMAQQLKPYSITAKVRLHFYFQNGVSSLTFSVAVITLTERAKKIKLRISGPIRNKLKTKKLYTSCLVLKTLYINGLITRQCCHRRPSLFSYQKQTSTHKIIRQHNPQR